MNYCCHCGHAVTFKIPDDDNMLRYVCDNSDCGMIHYQNPKVVAGCIVTWQGRLMLCKRAIDPRSGLWTIPAGFMENGETTDEAAARETLEEACAEVRGLELFAVYNIPHVNQVYVIFRSELDEPAFAPGAESLEVELFDEDAIPWKTLAFAVVDKALRRFCAARRNGDYRPFIDDVHHAPAKPRGVSRLADSA